MTHDANADVRLNRALWESISDEYQRDHDPQLSRTPMGWGIYSIPESELRILGDVAGLDVLELGCGAAQWSTALAGVGARSVGLDLSTAQLAHARARVRDAGATVRLVQGSATSLPLADRSFDVVFADHGAMGFADPRVTVPEVARVLRPGGRFAFSIVSPFATLTFDEAADAHGDRLLRSYFDLHRLEFDDWGPGVNVEYQLPFGEWIRLFRGNGFAVEDLVELQRPQDAQTTYQVGASPEWTRRWPFDHVWKLRREAAS